MNDKIIDYRYKIIGKIAGGGISTIYKALDINLNKVVALKLFKNNLTSNRIEDIIRFRKEAQIIAELNHESVIKLLSYGHTNDVNYLVMELISGESISKMLKKGHSFLIEEIIDIMIKTARALDYVHKNKVLHLDLKPGNIMLIPLEHENVGHIVKSKYNVVVLDFGLSQIIELANFRNKELIKGTFSYMSPEQSGIIKRQVDERSDLYSLGIVFYELLTGKLPFTGTSISEILHKQAAFNPINPTSLNHVIPKVLDRIILKLLKKDPLKRYRSATGLINDLERIKKGNLDFIPGNDDRNDRFEYKTRIIGRTKELIKLKRLLEDAATGRGSLCFISGIAGIGKSRLIEEFQDFCFKKNILFINSRCINQETKIPYLPVKNIFEKYSRLIQDEEKNIKDKTIKKLKQNIKGFGELILNLTPAMKIFLKDTPDLTPLDVGKENKRFLITIANLLCNLGDIDNPCVLFIDDLQWSDEGTIALLSEISKKVNNHPLFIISTFRSNEITNFRSLRKLLDLHYDEDQVVRLFKLKTLQFDHTYELLAELLNVDKQDIGEIARFINDKSQGNPLFIIEITRQLIKQNVLIREEFGFRINWNLIPTIIIPDSIIKIIIQRIENIKSDISDILCYASVIGNTFYIDILFKLLTFYSKEKIISIIDEARELQLIEQRGHKIDFVHDQIKDAFYKKIPKYKRKDIHSRVASILAKKHKLNTDAVIYDLTNHYLKAGEYNYFIKYAIDAARKARKDYANNEAIKYFEVSLKIMEKINLKDSDKYIQAKKEVINLYIITGKNDKAITFAKELLDNNKINDKTDIYKSISEAYYKTGDLTTCEYYLNKVLKKYGVIIPDKKSILIIFIIKELIIQTVHKIIPRFFKSLTPLSKKHLDLCYTALPLGTMYIYIDLIKFILLNLRVLNLVEFKIKDSRSLALLYGGLGTLYMGVPYFKTALSYLNKSLKISREIDDEWCIANSYKLLGLCNIWMGNYKKSLYYLEEAEAIYEKVGDLWELSLVKNFISQATRYYGLYTDSLKAVKKQQEISKMLNDYHGLNMSGGISISMYVQLGQFDKAERLGLQYLKYSEQSDHKFALCVVNCNLGFLALERKNYDKAISYLEKAAQIFENNILIKNNTIQIFSLLAEAIIEYINDTKVNYYSTKKIRHLCNRSRILARKLPTHLGASLRVTAKYYELTGKIKKAEQYYIQSIDHNKKFEYQFELMKSFYQFGLFLDRHNREEAALVNWQNGFKIAEKIGNKPYIENLAKLLNIDLKEHNKKHTQHENIKTRFRIKEKLLSIVNLSQHLSSILHLDDLLIKIIDGAVEITGAQAGYMLLYEGIMKGKKIEEASLEELKVVMARNASKKDIDSHNYQLSYDIIKNILETKEPIVIKDAMNENEYKEYDNVQEYKLRSLLCCPIILKNKLIGIFCLNNNLSDSVFDEDNKELIKVYLTQAAISIENANLYSNMEQYSYELEAQVKKRTGKLKKAYNRLKKLAYNDHLSGLKNRRYFLEMILPEANQMMTSHIALQQQNLPITNLSDNYGLLIIDIDHFKMVNDVYGHKSGDMIIKYFSMILSNKVREGDFVLRWGGEEFMIILRSITHDFLLEKAEEIRSFVECYPFRVSNGEIVSKTCSIGGIVYPLDVETDDFIDFEQAISIADNALYYAKNHGRNQVIIVKPELNYKLNKKIILSMIESFDSFIQNGKFKIIKKDT